MKRIIAAVAATAVAAPLAMAPMAMAQASTTPQATVSAPNVNKTTVLQAGATRQVLLGRVAGGSGYSWRWVTRPKSPVAKGITPKVVVTRKNVPGAPTIVYARIIGLGEGKTSGVMGLFGPGARTSTPTKTVTIAITVTEDGR